MKPCRKCGSTDRYLPARGKRYGRCRPCHLRWVQTAGRQEWLWLQKYGLSRAAYERFLIGQNGRCAICGASMDEPHVDHNHNTGVVRGLLCFHCNLILGHAKDESARLRAAADYIDAFGATTATALVPAE